MLNILINIAMGLSFVEVIVGFAFFLVIISVSGAHQIANNEDRKKIEDFCKKTKSLGTYLLIAGAIGIAASLLLKSFIEVG